MSNLSAADVIRLLGLKPHPEGGHFRETFRDERASGGRAASTAIYFLLAADEVSHWHRVDAAELWHWHAGAALELAVAPPGEPATRLRLGGDLAAGERPQAVVPALHWQSARSLGDWTLVGCTVAPGFEFAGFEHAPEGFEPANLLQRKDVAGGAQK
jgi:predicted cupin superfamily sugar epimerase